MARGPESSLGGPWVTRHEFMSGLTGGPLVVKKGTAPKIRPILNLSLNHRDNIWITTKTAAVLLHLLKYLSLIKQLHVAYVSKFGAFCTVGTPRFSGRPEQSCLMPHQVYHCIVYL
jgi:hypothetical protein